MASLRHKSDDTEPELFARRCVGESGVCAASAEPAEPTVLAMKLLLTQCLLVVTRSLTTRPSIPSGFAVVARSVLPAASPAAPLVAHLLTLWPARFATVSAGQHSPRPHLCTCLRTHPYTSSTHPPHLLRTSSVPPPHRLRTASAPPPHCFHTASALLSHRFRTAYSTKMLPHRSAPLPHRFRTASAPLLHRLRTAPAPLPHRLRTAYSENNCWKT